MLSTEHLLLANLVRKDIGCRRLQPERGVFSPLRKLERNAVPGHRLRMPCQYDDVRQRLRLRLPTRNLLPTVRRLHAWPNHRRPALFRYRKMPLLHPSAVSRHTSFALIACQFGEETRVS